MWVVNANSTPGMIGTQTLLKKDDITRKKKDIMYDIYIYILVVYSWENNGKSSIRATPMVNGQS